MVLMIGSSAGGPCSVRTATANYKDYKAEGIAVSCQQQARQQTPSSTVTLYIIIFLLLDVHKFIIYDS